MAAVGIIPARYHSVRFPGKALAKIGGRPMVQHVYERASQASLLKEVIVATDDERIARAVREFGGRCEMTRRNHPSGSDRVGEVAARLSANFIVNIQGDEPFVSPEAIDMAIEKLQSRPDAMVSTLIRSFTNMNELFSANTAKVVVDRQDYALYFSRAVIPFNRDVMERGTWLSHHRYFQHIGLYVFRREFLLKFVTWPPTALEKIEKLEQLRILERGYKIVCGETEYESLCVDTPEDLIIANEKWKEFALAKGREN